MKIAHGLYALLAVAFLPYASAEIKLYGQGEVANASIEMVLTIDDQGVATGYYQYNRTQIPIDLEGSLEGSSLRLMTVKNPTIQETFVGQVELQEADWPKQTNVYSYTGSWVGKHLEQGEQAEGFSVLNPLADAQISYDEMAKFPDLVFGNHDLGSGRGSPLNFESRCTNSLANQRFLKNLLSVAGQIRGNPSAESKCYGTSVFAMVRYHNFRMAWHGYSPLTFERYTGIRPANERFKRWSYDSLHNRALYETFVDEYALALPELEGWYREQFDLNEHDLQKAVQSALDEIALFAYGHESDFYSPDMTLVPGTEQAIKGDESHMRASLANATDIQKLNSLRRLIVHNATTDLIRVVAQSVKSKQPQTRRTHESPVSLAVKKPDVVRVLIDSGFDVNQPNGFGKTPLFYAIEHNEHDSVELLLQQGANINQQYQDNLYTTNECFDLQSNGKTPLMHAAQHSDSDMVELLFENGADMTVRDAYGKSVVEYSPSDEVTQFMADHEF